MRSIRICVFVPRVRGRRTSLTQFRPFGNAQLLPASGRPFILPAKLEIGSIQHPPTRSFQANAVRFRRAGMIPLGPWTSQMPDG